MCRVLLSLCLKPLTASSFAWLLSNNRTRTGCVFQLLLRHFNSKINHLPSLHQKTWKQRVRETGRKEKKWTGRRSWDSCTKRIKKKKKKPLNAFLGGYCIFTLHSTGFGKSLVTHCGVKRLATGQQHAAKISNSSSWLNWHWQIWLVHLDVMDRRFAQNTCQVLPPMSKRFPRALCHMDM